jgi:tetratricopeptide (TPR) repeat protein
LAPQKRLGECHTVRTNAMYNLAESLAMMGEEDEPAELFLRVVACTRTAYAPDNIIFLGMLSDSLRYIERGRRGVEGEALARELSATLRKFSGSHGDMTYGPDLFVASFVSIQGRLDEADALFRPLIAVADTQHEFRTSARAHLMFANHLIRCRRFEEAEIHLNAASAIVGDIRQGTWDSHPDDIILGYTNLYKAWNKPEKLPEYERLRAEALGRHGG